MRDPEIFAPDAMLDSIRQRIATLDLDLGGLRVVTEAATGAYACTAVIAAMAGARVHAVARDSRHGSFDEAAQATLSLARAAGVGARISVGRGVDRPELQACDIITNSGHLRPISAEMIEALPKAAVLALMFEAWEFRGQDFDLAACRRRAIAVAAVNERHPDVGVFPFLGPLCVRLLADAGQALGGSHVAVLCDNPFAPFIAQGLREAGAKVQMSARLEALDVTACAVLVLALDPARNPPLGAPQLHQLARSQPDLLLAQFWGDLDRAAWAGRICPAQAPAPGHMGILLNALGHEPIVRLQAGGLKAAEIAFRQSPQIGAPILERL